MENCLCFFFFITACLFHIHPGVEGIVGNYGLLGDNLPPPEQVVAFLKSRNIHKIRTFDPNSIVLNALHCSHIGVTVGVKNQDLQPLSSSPKFATTWVNTNIVPYVSCINFTYISAGNEVIPGSLASYVLGAMQNLVTALKAANILVSVSTAVSMQVLGSSYPPSTGSFSEGSISTMKPIVEFLAAQQAPLLANIYPYCSYTSDPTNVKLDFATLQPTAQGATDGSYFYTNLFDSMVDAAYSALEMAGGSSVDIVVSETGWPSAGNGDATTKENAQTYVNNLINHVASGKGTPKRSGKELETYVFALFNEDLKHVGIEQHWGLFYHDFTEVYHVNFP